MVKVPQYVDSVQLRGRNQQSVQANTSAETFGAGIGRAMVGLGGAVGDVADMMATKVAVEDAARARKGENEYREIRRQVLYDPESGYLNQQGDNALGESRAKAHEALAKARSDISVGMTDRQRRTFEEAADNLDNAAKNATIQHEGVEFKNFVMGEFSATAQSLLDEAILNSGSDQLFNENVQKASAEIDNIARLGGLPKAERDAKQAELMSNAQAGRVVELARENPIKAYEYLQTQRDNISNAQFDKLYQGLEPVYYDQLGEGFMDARGGIGGEDELVPTGDIISYGYKVNDPASPTTRNKPISRKMATAFESLRGLGLGFEISSGGQDGIETGSDRRVGTTRHDHGNAADGYFTKGGRRLNWKNEGDQAMIVDGVVALYRAGMTGIGAGDGYMGEGMVHLGYGGKAIWGKDGDKENAAPWLKAVWARLQAEGDMQGPPVQMASSGQVANDASDVPGLPGMPPSTVGVTMADALQIQDPKLRAVVLRKIEQRRSAYASDRQERKRVAEDKGWEIVDNGGSIKDIDPALQAEIGQRTINTMMTTIEQRVRGIDVTDYDVKMDLMEDFKADPAAFSQINLREEKPNLSRADYEELLALQDVVKQGLADPVGAFMKDTDWTRAMTEVEGAYTEMVGPKNKFGDEEKKQFSNVNTTFRQAMSAFVENNRRAPTYLERREMMDRLMLPMAIDGVTDQKSGPGALPFNLADVAQTRRRGQSIEMLLAGEDVPTGDYNRIYDALDKVYGRPPSEDEVVEQFENELLMSVGVDPSFTFKDIPESISMQIWEQNPNISELGIVEIWKQMALDAATEDYTLPTVDTSGEKPWQPRKRNPRRGSN